jgi:hypothetical protein
MLEYSMKHFIFLICLVGCTAPPVTSEAPDDRTVLTPWKAPVEMCLRHTEAAKTNAAYLLDICVIECDINPEQPWCSDTRKILNDQRRDASSPE